MLYGSMPPGGMVNLIAKRPQRESRHSVSVASGTGTLKELTLDSTGALNDQFAYRLVGWPARKRPGGDLRGGALRAGTLSRLAVE